MPFDGIVYEEAFTWCSWSRKRLLVLSLANLWEGAVGTKGRPVHLLVIILLFWYLCLNSA